METGRRLMRVIEECDCGSDRPDDGVCPECAKEKR